MRLYGGGWGKSAEPPICTATAARRRKLALYQSMLESAISNVALARELGVTEAVVRRLVNLDHPSRLDRLEKALGVLGKKLTADIQVLAA